MADKFAINYSMPVANHSFSAVWKLTRVMKAAGWETVSHSDGTTKTAAGTNNNDSWGNNADPLLDTYPAFDAAAAWIVMRGPSNIKLQFTTPPTGVFVRGEPVTQATSGATGELVGYVWDSLLAVGWAVIMPRTGTFDDTNIVTGAISTATFTPNVMKTFIREVVFAKQVSNVNNGSAYYICAEATAEAAQLYSTLAASAGATATVPPGAGGTGNGFPALGITVRGTGGSVSHSQWLYSATTNYTGLVHAAAVNAVPGAGISADGSFYCLMGRGDVAGALGMFGFFRVDDGEPGDVDPYVWYWANNSTHAAFSRTVSTSFAFTNYESWGQFGGSNRTYACWKGYAARDGYVTERDVAMGFVFTFKNTSNNTYFPQANSAQPAAMTIVNQPSTDTIYVREPIGVCTTGQISNIKMVKGNIRWLSVISTGSYKDLLDNRKLIVLFPFVNAQNPACVLGPWDGTTVPG